MSVAEAIELLLKIAREDGAQPLATYLQTPEGRSRVRALHHLAGGNHRVYIVLAELIDRESLDELVGPFEKMVDELTPYYQERLRWLAPQQRRIVELLCTQTAPVPVKSIAHQLFATEQTVAAQLKRLRELGYVVRASGIGRSSFENAWQCVLPLQAKPGPIWKPLCPPPETAIRGWPRLSKTSAQPRSRAGRKRRYWRWRNWHMHGVRRKTGSI